MSAVADVLAAVLILLALLVLTVAAIGLLRNRDLYLQLHAAGKAVVLGVAMLLLPAVLIDPGAMLARALLTGLFLLVTAPVAAHAMALAIRRRAADADAERRASEP